MTTENCPFLNTSGTNRSPDHERINLQVMHSQFLGRYWCTEMALLAIGVYRKEKDIKGLNINQALVNCANKILAANQLDNIPYVVTSDQYAHLKQNLDKIQKHYSQPVTLINLEETMGEKVDHTLKASALLFQFASKLEDQQAFSKFSPSIQDMVLSRIAGVDELVAILEYLCEEKQLSGKILNGFSPGYTPEEEAPFNDDFCFTMNGWKQIQIEKEKTNTNKVFIATSFNWPEDNSTRLEIIEAIKSACKRLGWEADVVSQSHTDYITDKIMSEIRSSKFVVAELTYHNRGVYFESGYARGLGKNVFHIVKDGYNQILPEAEKENKRIHFDIQQVQYRTWNSSKEAEDKLYDWINSTFGNYKESYQTK